MNDLRVKMFPHKNAFDFSFSFLDLSLTSNFFFSAFLLSGSASKGVHLKTKRKILRHFTENSSFYFCISSNKPARNFKLHICIFFMPLPENIKMNSNKIPRENPFAI
jgi:uncharacterized protein (UPF0303 family)